jgi:imidazolonepropionase-like amidohydrolase
MNKYTVLLCGKLFDGVHEELFEKMEILVENNRIAAVGRGVPRPEGAEIVDLSDMTVTPGLIDNHIHSDFWEWKNRRVEMFTTSDEWKILSALHSAQNSLIRGFTTVRHLNIGIQGYGLADVKRAINAGYFAGSRVFVANHRLGSHGGHPDTSGYFRDNPRLSELTVQPGIGTGADFFRMAVRKEIKYGSDVIKFMSTAGMFGPATPPHVHAGDKSADGRGNQGHH